MSEQPQQSSILSTPVAILIAGILISAAVLYSRGDLPFLSNKAASNNSENPVAKVEDGPYAKYINLATSINLNADQFKACVEKQDSTEVKKDLAEANAAGINGTPAFYIGKRVDGNSIEGVGIFGAFPIASFTAVIEAIKSGDQAKILVEANSIAKQSGAPEFKTYKDAVKIISLDDDPKMGSDSAQVVMVEFSDYECPFCKRHITTTYPALKSTFIDKGELQLVFRDLPLPFHDPVATEAAIAVNCAREQGGDEAYFKYHDAYFAKTQTNGKGL